MEGGEEISYTELRSIVKVAVIVRDRELKAYEEKLRNEPRE